MWDVIIIGAGVIGSAIARELSRYELKTLVLEKETDVCEATSMANSGIVHSGYDPQPGSLKARLNVQGNKLFEQLSLELGFEFQRIGSLTVASKDKLDVLKELQNNGVQNGVKTQIVCGEELHNLEPNLAPDMECALWAETAGIINPFEYTVALMENAIDNGVQLNLCEEVLAINKTSNGYSVISNLNNYESKMVINAAGVQSGVVAGLIGSEIDIRPRKGEYFVINRLTKPLVKHIVFPLPSNKGKGVLVTPTTSSNYLVGPSSEFVQDYDDLSTDTSTLDNIKESANKIIANIPYHEVIRSFAGLRSVNSQRDFIIKEDEQNANFYHVAGIESPGLASSYAIALYLIDLIKEKHKLSLNSKFNPYRRPFVKLKNLDIEAKNACYQKDRSYARIVCRCEQISEGEIVDVINRKAGARTVRGVKKRVRPGFGKCQGGFCESLVLDILKRELHLSPKEVLYAKNGSEIIKEITKEVQESEDV